MTKQEKTFKEAETFVRKVLAMRSGKIDEKTIQSVARKVSKAIPPYSDKELVEA